MCSSLWSVSYTHLDVYKRQELTGRDLVDGEFSFELYEGANKLQTVTNLSLIHI